MGHDKLRKFKENESFDCLLQPLSEDVLDVSAGSCLVLKDHSVKGRWNATMFAKEQPIVLELGCGKGEYTIDLALRNPGLNYIGLDIKGARLWKGAKYASVNKLPNVAFLRTRIEFIEAFFAPGEVSEIWLTFSDPQMKSENSRLTSPRFLERYRSFLKPGGVVHLKTDSMFLHQYSKAVVEQNGFQMLFCTEDLYGEGLERLKPQAGAEISEADPAGQAGDKVATSGDVAAGTGLHASKGVGAGELASVCGEDAVDALFEVQTFYEKMFLKQGLKITYLSFVLDNKKPVLYPEFDADYWRNLENNRLG